MKSKNLKWAIRESVYDWIITNIPKGSTILELGSGNGTTATLCDDYILYSVEHVSVWLNQYKSQYIKTSVKGGWYVLTKEMLPTNYDLLIIDGPIWENRVNFINHFTLFRTDVPIIIDDSERVSGKTIVNFLTRLNYVITAEDTAELTKQWVVMTPNKLIRRS